MLEDLPSALLVEMDSGVGVSYGSKHQSLPPPGRPSSSSAALVDSGKYVRYSNEQVDILERLYIDCPKPSSLRRQQLIRENPILQNIESKQIKVWFQNRRCREKQRKETCRLQNLNGKLTAMNKLLMEENDRLQKQVAELLYSNGCLHQQLQIGGVTTDGSCDSVVTSSFQQLQTSHHSQSNASHSGILSLAQETLKEFLSKATGTAVDWIPIPGMKPGPDSTTMFNISHGCSGVAARACGLVGLEPGKVSDIIKDRPSWQHDCRRLQRLYASSTSNGGILEVLYVQMYAPTTLAPARDFCTLRYTSLLEDGSYVICERSVNGSYGVPTAPVLQPFVRAEMYASGCLIRPCEGTGSIVILVDHMDLEPWSVPEVLRPIYDSSSGLARNLTIAAMQHLRYRTEQAASETVGGTQQLTTIYSLKHRLARGFSDAVNGLDDDGWSTIASNGIDDVTLAIKAQPTAKDAGVQLASLSGGFLCAKASMLLQNVSPSLIMSFLREHRSEWADLNSEFNPAILSKANARIFKSQILHQNRETEEILELIRVEGQSSLLTRDMLLLQLCSGLDKNASGACAQMVFAPIDDSISGEAPLLLSGFRIIPLENGSVVGNSPKRTLDLASSLEVGAAVCGRNVRGGDGHHMRSVLTLAFQFSIESHIQESMATLARQYVRNVMSTVQRIALALAPSSILNMGVGEATWEPSQNNLAWWIVRSYKLNLGSDMVGLDSANFEKQQLVKALWHHSNALLCCSYKSIPVFTYANEAGLEMLETSHSALSELSWEATLDEDGRKNMCAVFSQVILDQGYLYLHGGIRISSKGRPVSFERAIVWRVMDDSNNIQALAFMYFNCTKGGGSSTIHN